MDVEIDSASLGSSLDLHDGHRLYGLSLIARKRTKPLIDGFVLGPCFADKRVYNLCYGLIINQASVLHPLRSSTHRSSYIQQPMYRCSNHCSLQHSLQRLKDIVRSQRTCSRV